MRSKLLGYAATAVAAGALSINASAGTVTTEGEDIVIKTKGGFEAKRADDAFSFKLGGRVQVQYDQFQDSMNLIDGDGDTGSALFIRRARVYLKGTMYDDWAYKIQFNVADSGSGGGTFEDLYVRWTGAQWANITVGKHKEPFSLQELTSSKWVTTVERAAVTDFFAEGRSLGIAIHGVNNFGGYALGAYDNGGSDDEGAQLWAFTGRGFLSPINTDRGLFHVGLALSTRDEGDQKTTAEVTQGIKKGDEITAQFVSPTKRRNGYNLDLAGKIGPVHAQAEYSRRTRDASDGGEDATTSGWYAQAGWFITGESRTYKKGRWDKIKPNREGGLGAWELFGRVEGLDFDDDGIVAENRNKGNIYVAGVNWYPNQIVRVSANYVYTSWDNEVVSVNAETDPEKDEDLQLWRADYVAAASDYTAESQPLDSGHGFAIRMQAAF